ncbi:uncharacterized protein LOC113352461 [Papaver somniferum]|uniref:uncharacterized protein LOC113352461 n=1 Tax=Papaver somniferum TaxID=3469 RepID=UPI000E6F9C5E|nr:uncharacterized protein LOC113352461 [Papaver somniferum]
MGNCLFNNNCQVEEEQENSIERIKIHHNHNHQKNVVKLNFGGINDDDDLKKGSSGVRNVVRVRIIMTQEELSQILRYNNQRDNGLHGDLSKEYTTTASHSIEQLLNVMKTGKVKVVSKVRRKSETTNCNWKPHLESIPEDQY